MYFTVTEGARYDKLGNAREGSATGDGVKALMRNTYAGSDIPLLRARNMMVNERKSFVEMSRGRQAHPGK